MSSLTIIYLFLSMNEKQIALLWFVFLENNIINYFSTIHILEIHQWQGVQTSQNHKCCNLQFRSIIPNWRIIKFHWKFYYFNDNYFICSRNYSDIKNTTKWSLFWWMVCELHLLHTDLGILNSLQINPIMVRVEH